MTPAEEAEIIRTHKPFVWKHALRAVQTGGGDLEECVQEMSIELVKACRKWRADGGANIRTFATKYLQHSAIREWKKRNTQSRRHIAVSFDELEEVANEPGANLGACGLARRMLASCATDAKQESDLIAKEQGKTLRAAIGKLPVKQRYILRRHYFEGETLEQIGESFGLTRERIRQIEVAAIATLRRLLEGSGLE